MPRTFPVRICRCNFFGRARSPSAPLGAFGEVALPYHGFTFVEVIVALAVASILLGVATSTVITSLRAEQTVLWRNEANLVADRIISANCLGTNPSNVMASLDASWITENSVYESSNVSWSVWTISKKDRTSSGINFALRN